MADYKVRHYEEAILGQEGSIIVEGGTVTEEGIQLIGIGSTDYPITMSESLLWQLENFANETPPQSSVRGQLWFDTSTLELKVDQDGNGTWVGVSVEGEQGEQGEQGPIGPQGEPGPAIDWQGDWSPLITYTDGQTVLYNGSSYFSLTDTDNLNKIPSDNISTYWGVLAEAGSQGQIGITGPPGLPGEDGVDGPQGIPGIDGTDGLPGDPGLNGYQLYVTTGTPTGGNPGDMWIEL